MVTTRISYNAMHYELGHHQSRHLPTLHEISRLRIHSSEEPPPDVPVLYVAMATWIPKCNMYHYNPESNEDNEETRQQIATTNTEPPIKSVKSKQENEISKIEEVIDVDSDSNNLELESKKNENLAKPDSIKDNSVSSHTESDTSDTESDLDISQMDESKCVDLNSSQDSKDFNDSVMEVDTTTSNPSSSKISPKKPLTPRQIQKNQARVKEREAKQLALKKKKEELLEQKQKMKAERDKLRNEKREQREKEKQEKIEQKQKEMEAKLKEKELKEEKKKKEREEKEQKRKEKEEKEEQKRKEIEEKNIEKQKQQEKKQKAAAAFVTFFMKKSEEEKKIEGNDVTASNFMPFEVKADMKLAPSSRISLTEDKKSRLLSMLENQTGETYLEELKSGKDVGRTKKTWPIEDQSVQDDAVIVVDSNPGESIEEMPRANKMKAKFLKFNDNRRPPYFGTWRKKSKCIKARKPFAIDKEFFDYEVDSDEDWEEEDSGESLQGSDDEEKENDSENEYEVDNEFFVPHGYLSGDEVDEEEFQIESPESHKAKLKLLKKEFEEEMMGKTQKLKSRVIGCIWFNKDEKNVDPVICDFLKPFAIMHNGPITIKKRSKLNMQTPSRKNSQLNKLLPDELVPDFLKFIHGSTRSKKSLVNDFLHQLTNKNMPVDVSKASLKRQMIQFAEWRKCPEDGVLHNKFCWYVRNDVKEKHNVELSLQNKQ